MTQTTLCLAVRSAGGVLEVLELGNEGNCAAQPVTSRGHWPVWELFFSTSAPVRFVYKQHKFNYAKKETLKNLKDVFDS